MLNMSAANRSMGLSFGCVLIGVLAGAAATHAVQSVASLSTVDTGLFVVGDRENASLHLTFGGRPGAPSARASMRFLDAQGAIVARQDVTLAPGQSRTLTMQQAGAYRAQISLSDSGNPDDLAVLSTVELSSIDDESIRRFVCKPGDVITTPGYR